jgi:hypothetical protein
MVPEGCRDWRGCERPEIADAGETKDIDVESHDH